MRTYNLLEFLGLFAFLGALLGLKGEYLVTGKALLLEVPLFCVNGLLDLRNLRKPPWCKRLQSIIEEESIVNRVGVPLLLVQQIYLPIIDIDEPRTEEVVALKIEALDSIAADQGLKVIINHRCDSFETVDIVYKEDLEEFLQYGGD